MNELQDRNICIYEYIYSSWAVFVCGYEKLFVIAKMYSHAHNMHLSLLRHIFTIMCSNIKSKGAFKRLLHPNNKKYIFSLAMEIVSVLIEDSD